MRAVLRLAAAGATTAMLGLVLLPVLAAAVIAGQLRRASAIAEQWDIPPELVPVFEEAGRGGGIPWFLLAGVASVATDFARHGPDGVARGDTIGTSIFPTVTPPIRGDRGGEGMFLLDLTTARPDPGNPQDVRAASEYLAGALVGPGGASQALAQPEAARFWIGVIARLPLRISGVATDHVSASAGADIGAGNPIRHFGGGVLARLGAPVTASNIDAIDAWAAGEGSCALHNPLDTTQPEAGATPFNTLAGGGHVWNYPSWEVGIRATTETLLNGLYDPIIDALRASAGVAAVEGAVARSPWGTRSFGSATYSGEHCGRGQAVAPPALPTVGGPESIPATVVARAARYQSIWEEGLAGTTPGSYRLPVDTAWYLVHPEWFQRPHRGFPAVDIPVPAGTPVDAVTSGQVIAADEAGGATGCGHDVRMLGRDGIIYTYCHGSEVLVPNGQQVAAGEVIMRSGWSGTVIPAGPAGAHLHFQIDVPGRPGSVCPQPVLAAWATGRNQDPHVLPAVGCVS